jgi:hypothetical protein
MDKTRARKKRPALVTVPKRDVEFRTGIYRVSLRGVEVIIYDTDRGKICAIGTWYNGGGYVRYPGDGANSRYNWSLLDTIDKELRARLDWVHQATGLDRPSFTTPGRSMVSMAAFNAQY